MKRKFKVPRGTGALVAGELKLAPSHVTRVINGKREGGSTLVTRLEEIERAYVEERPTAGRLP